MNIKCLDRTRNIIFKARRYIMTEFSYEHGKKIFFYTPRLAERKCHLGRQPFKLQ